MVKPPIWIRERPFADPMVELNRFAEKENVRTASGVCAWTRAQVYERLRSCGSVGRCSNSQRHRHLDTFPYSTGATGSAAQFNCSVSSMPAAHAGAVRSFVGGRHGGYTA